MHIAAIRGHARCLSMLSSSLRTSTMCAHPELAASVLQALLSIPETKTTVHDLKTLISAITQLSTGGITEDQMHNGSNLAFASVCANRGDLVQALVELKAKSCVPANGFSSIAHTCAFFNRPNILAMLNIKNIDCSSFDTFHRTPLHICMINGSVEAAIALVQLRQFPARAKDDFGLTAVNYLTIELLKSAKINRVGLKLCTSWHCFGNCSYMPRSSFRCSSLRNICISFTRNGCIVTNHRCFSGAIFGSWRGHSCDANQSF